MHREIQRQRLEAPQMHWKVKQQILKYDAPVVVNLTLAKPGFPRRYLNPDLQARLPLYVRMALALRCIYPDHHALVDIDKPVDSGESAALSDAVSLVHIPQHIIIRPSALLSHLDEDVADKMTRERRAELRQALLDINETFEILSPMSGMACILRTYFECEDLPVASADAVEASETPPTPTVVV